MSSEIINNVDNPKSNFETLLKQPSTTLVLDLDGTLLWHRYYWTEHLDYPISPEAVAALRLTRNKKIPLVISTGQTFSEMDTFLTTISTLVLNKPSRPTDLFPTIIGSEGTEVIINKSSITSLIPDDYLQKRDLIYGRLLQKLSATHDTLYGTLLAPMQSKSTITIWTYDIDPTAEMMNDIVTELGFSNEVSIRKISNCTVTIVPKDFSKGHALNLLCSLGVIDLNKIIYMGDGENEEEVLDVISGTQKGLFIAPGNAIPSIKNSANFVTKHFGDLGIAEIIAKTFPREFKKALKQVIKEADLRERKYKDTLRRKAKIDLDYI